MTITRLQRSVIVVLLLLLASCTQTPTKTEFDKTADFSKLKTYAWGKNTISMEKTGKTVDQTVEDIGRTVRDNIQSLVNAELKAKNFTLTDKEKPDFVVQYAAKSKVEEIVTREMYAPGAVTAPTNMARTGTMQMGTLTIFILEPGTMKLLWRAQTDTIMKFDGKTKYRLEKVIKKMFNDFPPNSPHSSNSPVSSIPSNSQDK